MGEVVNLRRARKDRTRAEADKKADANRLAFGRTKSEKSLTQAERAIAERRIDGHRLDGPLDDRD
ncbi:MAG: DUF4169 family protein [Beijerinckiaceae bacterium]|nr:DUF4169 family protein [Beijerinckiaceae bacterium]